jgi:hypothetical protein
MFSDGGMTWIILDRWHYNGALARQRDDQAWTWVVVNRIKLYRKP